MFAPLTPGWLHEQVGPYRSLAVVGNGPSVLTEQRGSYLDSTDIVVRFNEFAVEGFESYVGSRTDVYVTHLLHTYDNRHLRAHGVKAVIASRPQTARFAFNSGLGRMLMNLQRLGDLPLAWADDQRFLGLYALLNIPLTDMTGRNPTSGLVFLDFASQLNLDYIEIVGFDGYAPGLGVHYFSDPRYEQPSQRRVTEYAHQRPQELRALTVILNRFTCPVLVNGVPHCPKTPEEGCDR